MRKQKKGSVLSACAALIRLRLSRGDGSESSRRVQLKKNGLEVLKPQEVFDILNKQGWQPVYEVGYHFYLPVGGYKAKTAYILHGGVPIRVSMDLISKNPAYIMPSFDRIDSNGEYEANNIQLTSKYFNKAKSDMPQSEFEEWTKRVTFSVERAQ